MDVCILLGCASSYVWMYVFGNNKIEREHFWKLTMVIQVHKLSYFKEIKFFNFKNF